MLFISSQGVEGSEEARKGVSANRSTRFVGRKQSREMVTKTEETQLNQLENQVDNGGGGAWEYLSLVRKLKVRRSEQVLKHGSSILSDSGKRSALGPDGLLISNS